jgi:hypothetical protein
MHPGQIGPETSSHKRSDEDALGMGRDCLGKRWPSTGRIQAAFGRDLLASLRHETGSMGAEPAGESHHLVSECHLEIERPEELGHQPLDVAIPDVAAVLAQVCRDPVGTCLRSELSRAHRVWVRAAAGVPHRRDVVDVDPQPQGP